ncbi:M20-dimer domain-containing protein [Fusarium sp. Ph1]|nr:M20-dimer domain-containing protein [Fusarium sp. Ph1]
MQDYDIGRVKVDSERLNSLLHDTCRFGTGERWGRNSAATETGMARLALSDSDKQARDWFVSTTEALGCSTTVDEMGNIFAIRPGRRQGPATFVGSHLDTQPRGGRYDGILGVLAGVEILNVLKDHGIETEFPVGVVNWTNEEGARFPIIMVASGVWAGKIPLQEAHDLKEVSSGSCTMRSELERIGYLGSTRCSFQDTPMAAYFELHIDQGPILEANNQKVGVVTGVQAYRWFTVQVIGQGAHSGTTPLSERADASLLASRLILHCHRLATKHDAVATTGIIEVSSGSVNTIPGHVRFTIDMRAPHEDTLELFEKELMHDAHMLALGTDIGGLMDASTPGKSMTVCITKDTTSPAVTFHPDCVDIVRASAASVTSSHDLFRDMTSGAGHDAAHANLRCPAGMVFVSSKGGISHNPVEYTSPEDCAIGAEVLLQSVLRYDQLRAKRGSESV